MISGGIHGAGIQLSGIKPDQQFFFCFYDGKWIKTMGAPLHPLNKEEFIFLALHLPFFPGYTRLIFADEGI